jgi:hypothetical protein
MLLAPAGLGVVLSAWAAYVVFRLVLAVGLRLLRPPEGLELTRWRGHLASAV